MHRDPIDVLEQAITISTMGTNPSRGPGGVISRLSAESREALAELRSKDISGPRLPCLGWDWGTEPRPHHK